MTTPAMRANVLLSTGQMPAAPEQIVQARLAAGLTQKEAGAIIYSTRRTWQDWELGARRMHPALFELFLIKTNQIKPIP